MSTLINLAGSGGLATGIIGIPDGSGWYTFYASLDAAMTAAVSGDTIVFFDDYTETASVAVTYKDGVDINLNGHTYEYSNADNSDTLTDGGVAATINIYNGVIKRTNAAAPTFNVAVTLRLSNASTTVNLNGVDIVAENGSCTLRAEPGIVNGGNFKQVGVSVTQGLSTNGGELNNISFYAETREASIGGGTVATNCTFRSDGLYAVYIITGQTINCTGYSTASFGIYVGNAGQALNCTGVSEANNGINLQTGNSQVQNCVARSSGGAAILNRGVCKGTSAYSTAGYGIQSVSTSFTDGCTAWTSASIGVYTSGPVSNTSSQSTLNTTGGHAFGIATNGTKISNCTARVSNAGAYAVNFAGFTGFVTGVSGEGMTNLLSAVAQNTQTNPEDNFGNILIG